MFETCDKYLKNYLKESCKKSRIVFGIIVAMILFAFSFAFVKNESSTHFIISLGISVIIGLLCVFRCPGKWIQGTLFTLVYFLVAPTRIFYRMQVSTCGWDSFWPAAKLPNILILTAVFALFVLAFQRVNIGLGVGATLVSLLAIVDFYVTAFRGRGFVFNDITGMKTAAMVVDQYKFFISSELAYSLLYYILFIALGFWIRIDVKSIDKKAIYHIGLSAVALLYLAYFGWFSFGSDYYEKSEILEIYTVMGWGNKQWGFPLTFVKSIHGFDMEKPSGYSEKKLAQVSDEYGRLASTEQVPDIIFVMNESWTDLKILGNIETNEDPMPFYNSDIEGSVKGRLNVNIWGGLTCNSEFEALTAVPMSSLPANAIPFTTGIKEHTYSMVEELKQQGYKAIAMHPNAKASWNRGEVYSELGFDTFIDINAYSNCVSVGDFPRGMMPDKENYEELIRVYENEKTKSDEPLFLFNVTIQNHGGYGGHVPYEGIDTLSIEGEPVEKPETIDNYLNLVRSTDSALEMLVDYFKTVDRPVILCMFGDHGPILDDSIYIQLFEQRGLTEEEIKKLQYQSVYLMWSNYGADIRDYGDMSINYMGAALLDASGVALSPYFDYAVDMIDKYPDISSRSEMAFLDEAGLNVYRMLQYSALQGDEAYKPAFTVK